jgi:MFS family permease
VAWRLSATGAYIAGCAVSALGTGAVYPVNVIYLHLVRGLPVRFVGLSIIASALAAIGSAPVAGHLVARLGGRTVVVIALLTQAAGAAAMIGATSAPAALAAMTVQGLGNGSFYAAQTPLVTEIADGARRIRLLSLRYVINNAGIGVGAVLGGLVIATCGPPGYTGVYLANSASYLAFAVALATVPLTARRRPGQRAPGLRGYARLLGVRPLRRLLLLQFLIVSAGYAQVDSSLPLYAKQHLHLSSLLIGAVISVNSALVVLLQVPATHWVNRRGPRAAFRLLGLTWSLAMLVGCAAGLLPSTWAAAALFAAIGVFSAGECLYTPAFQTVLLDLAADEDVGGYAALASMTWTTALLIAPTVGIVLVQLPWPPAYWLTLALGGLVVAALSAGIGPSREAQRAHPAGEPR